MPSTMDEKLVSMETDLKAFIERHQGKSSEIDARLVAIEQRLTSRGPGPALGLGDKSVGALVTGSENFAAFKKGARSSGTIDVGSFFKKAVTITSGPWTVGPQYIPQMAAPAMPRLPLRALLPAFPTTSNLVEFPREDATSGGADYQYPEGTDKSQTDFSYSLQQAAVCQLSHWVAASKQMVDDSVAFQGYIDGRMLYLLDKKIEAELLFGTGAAGHLKGLCVQATVASGSPTNLIEATAAALAQLAAVGYAGDFIVCNPVDWWAVRTLKAVTAGTYLIGSPLDAQAPTLWGLAVSLSLSMPAGKFLVGVRTEAAVYDRQAATIEISREHASFFTQNLVAILCEERLALAVFHGTAFIYGTLASSGS